MSEPLDALLARPGLAPSIRLLVLAQTCTQRADWPGLATVAERARGIGVPRAAVEEALLQGVLFFGFPRSVTAFETVDSAWPAPAPPTGGELPQHTWREAGTRLFDAIYDRNAPAVHARLRGFHAAFHDFVIESAYGRVLSRPGLDPRTRELLAVGALAVLDQIPQLVAHGRGARRFGATEAELRETLRTALGTEAEAPLRRILGRSGPSLDDGG